MTDTTNTEPPLPGCCHAIRIDGLLRRVWTDDALREYGDARAAHAVAQIKARDALRKDAERYRFLRRGQHWSVVDGIGNVLRGDTLDAAIDVRQEGRAIMKPTAHLRFVWRLDERVLQQWHEAEGWEHEDTSANGGEWRDVPLQPETEEAP